MLSKYAALSRLATLLGFPIFGWVCTIAGGHLACALHSRSFLNAPIPGLEQSNGDASNAELRFNRRTWQDAAIFS